MAQAEKTDLVLENLEWRIADGDLEVIRYVELGTQVIDEALGLDLSSAAGVMVHPDSPGPEAFSEYEGSDAVRHRQEAGLERGLAIALSSDDKYVDLLLYEFADAEGASRYAEHLSARVVARARGYDVSPEPVPGLDGATAILTECSTGLPYPDSVGGDCNVANKAAAVAAQGRFVVAVEATDYEGETEDYPTPDEMLSQTVEILEEQINQL